MAAAYAAARRGLAVVMTERNSRPGRKLMITGKGRCNLTNACGLDEFLENVLHSGRFLYSALTAFGPKDTMDFFEGLGVPLKIERGKRVFPVSDKASDIVDALAGCVSGAGCRMINGRVKSVDIASGCVRGVMLDSGEKISAGSVIVCTGGMSYPLTGSTGDGYEIARSAGHTVIPPRASLVPLVISEQWPRELQGLTLKNVTLEAIDSKNGRTVFSELGEMLFTHFGVSGPLVLSASSRMRDMSPGRYTLVIDLKPGLSPEQLDARLRRDFLKYSNRDYINSLGSLLPAKLVPVFVRLSGIDPHEKANQLTRAQRGQICTLMKHIEMKVEVTRPIDEAIITSGGVKTSEIDPRTMESKLVKGLYFAGEVLDVDAYTGGFNLQIAFSTGMAAGRAVRGAPK
jgi:predicted Rossmann fold flavoprotein